MRLIDADELKTKVEAMVEHRVNESDYDFGRNQAFDYVADILIDDASPIDAVKVVRCKDCMYNDRGWCGAQEYGTRHVEDNGYCSYGERKDDE